MVNGSLELPIVDLTRSAESRLLHITPCLPLADQQQLTAVERFAIDHARETTPLQARYYESLLPAQPPGTGSAVWPSRSIWIGCSGCKACVTACHTLNGLDETRDLGAMWACSSAVTASNPLMQHVTTACSSLPRPRMYEGVSRLMPMRRTRSPGSSSTWNDHVSAASTARWPARTMCRNITRRKGSSVSATCARTGWLWEKPLRVCRPVPIRRSRFASSMWPRSWSERRG